MDLDRFPRGKAFDLKYHLSDIVKFSPERYFDCGIVRQHALFQGIFPVIHIDKVEDTFSKLGSKTLL